MDLQAAFYIVAIVAFILFIVFLLVAIYFIFFLKRLVTNTHKQVVGKIIEYTKPLDLIKELGNAVAGNLLMRFKDNFGMKYNRPRIKGR